jgi:hypothetical protein
MRKAAGLSWRMNILFALGYVFQLCGLPLVHFASGVVFVDTSAYSGGAWALFVWAIITMILIALIWLILSVITIMQFMSLHYGKGPRAISAAAQHDRLTALRAEAEGHHGGGDGKPIGDADGEGTGAPAHGTEANHSLASRALGLPTREEGEPTSDGRMHFVKEEMHPFADRVAEQVGNPWRNPGWSAWFPGVLWYGSEEGAYSGTPYGTPVVRMFGLFFQEANPANLWHPVLGFAIWYACSVILGYQCESKGCCVTRFAVCTGLSFLYLFIFIVRRPLLGDNIALTIALTLEFCLMAVCTAAIAADAVLASSMQNAIEAIVYATLGVLLAFMLLKLIALFVRSRVRHAPKGPWAKYDDAEEKHKDKELGGGTVPIGNAGTFAVGHR